MVYILSWFMYLDMDQLHKVHVSHVNTKWVKISTTILCFSHCDVIGYPYGMLLYHSINQNYHIRGNGKSQLG
jgi:hypothetical protein